MATSASASWWHRVLWLASLPLRSLFTAAELAFGVSVAAWAHRAIDYVGGQRSGPGPSQGTRALEEGEVRIQHGPQQSANGVGSALAGELEASGSFVAKPVGTLRSVFPFRFGTPRQGGLAPATRGELVLDPTVLNVHAALAGLEEFSHVWLIWVFHTNTNEFKRVSGKTNRSSIRPPSAGGSKVGLFATRSPHRPNPIGISLVRVRGVDVEAGKLLLTGLDLCDGGWWSRLCFVAGAPLAFASSHRGQWVAITKSIQVRQSSTLSRMWNAPITRSRFRWSTGSLRR